MIYTQNSFLEEMKMIYFTNGIQFIIEQTKNNQAPIFDITFCISDFISNKYVAYMYLNNSKNKINSQTFPPGNEKTLCTKKKKKQDQIIHEKFKLGSMDKNTSKPRNPAPNMIQNVQIQSEKALTHPNIQKQTVTSHLPGAQFADRSMTQFTQK